MARRDVTGPWAPRRAGASVRTVTGRPPRAATAPVSSYTSVVDAVPITGGQALGTFETTTLTLSVGPAGLGTIWYPLSAVISTSVGPYDSSQCQVYVGPAGLPTLLQGTLATGGAGTVSLAIPAIQPGLSVIAVWTGGTVGSTASLNVTGTMSALYRGAQQ